MFLKDKILARESRWAAELIDKLIDKVWLASLPVLLHKGEVIKMVHCLGTGVLFFF